MTEIIRGIMANTTTEECCVLDERSTFTETYSEIHVSPDEDEYQSSISIETSSFNEVPPCSDELPSRSKAKPDFGYVSIDSFIKNSKITDHRSYHGALSSSEANELLNLAPEKGYLTRYSNNKKRYVLSVFYPSIPDVRHMVLAIDEEAPSYVIRGTWKSFPGINQLLDYYEINPPDSKLENIGISYSPFNTRQLKQQHEEEKRKEDQQKNAQQKNNDMEEQKKQHKEDMIMNEQMMKMQQQILQQQAEAMRKEYFEPLLEPLAKQQKEYQDKILELQTANKELLEALDKKKSTHHTKCSIQ